MLSMLAVHTNFFLMVYPSFAIPFFSSVGGVYVMGFVSLAHTLARDLHHLICHVYFSSFDRLIIAVIAIN